MKRIISWNVNGIRAWEKKGMYQWFLNESPDIFCIQETKAQEEQLEPKLLQPQGYYGYFSSAEKKGYSGVAIYSKTKPISIQTLGDDAFDNEGRTLIAEYPEFTLINCYFPNSQNFGARLDYKLAFCQSLLKTMNTLQDKGKNILLCGDYNIAHKEIDLARPDDNHGSPGFLPEERAWMDTFIDAGYIDTFRHFTKEAQHYTWWSYRTRARERNVGWRIDYHSVNQAFIKKVKASFIHDSILGSDHCPLEVHLDIE